MATPVQPYVQDLVFANNASTTLSGPVTSGNTLPVAAGTGQLFPSGAGATAFVVTVISASNPTVFEIMLCTSRSGDVLTVLRAQEGTSRQTFAANDIVVSQWTAGQAATMLQQGQSPSFSPTSIVYFGIDTSAGPNTIVATTNPTFPNGYANGMLIEIQPAGSNTAPGVTCNVNGAGFIPLLNNDGSGLLIGEITGGQRFLCTYSAGANALKLISPPSIQSNTNVNFYINASTGNDSNNGLSAATAFQTINGAIAGITGNYQPVGEVTLNFANGTYPVGGFLDNSNIASWLFTGNPANVGAVLIQATGGTGANNNFGRAMIVQGATLTLQYMTLQSIYDNVFVEEGAIVTLDTCDFTTPTAGVGPSPPYFACVSNYSGKVDFIGACKWAGISGTCAAFSITAQSASTSFGYNSLYQATSFSLNVTGNPSVSEGFIWAEGGSSVQVDGANVTFSGGSMTGYEIVVGGCSIVSVFRSSGGTQPNFPGSGHDVDSASFGVLAFQ